MGQQDKIAGLRDKVCPQEVGKPGSAATTWGKRSVSAFLRRSRATGVPRKMGRGSASTVKLYSNAVRYDSDLHVPFFPRLPI